MKIVIPAERPDLDAPADPRFGRCACFAVVDPDTMECEFLENRAAAEVSGAGIAAATLVASAGAEVVIAGSLGPKAMDTLRAQGLTLYQGPAGTVRELLQAYRDGGLTEYTGPNVGAHHGMGGGGGRGMGRGRGRGMGGGRGRR